MKAYDVIIVGAGIIGLSIAWQLARRSKLSIAVLEKGAGVGEGSTGASSAVCRHRYSSDEMVKLARDGINAYKLWSEFTDLREPRAAFHEDGVLWMPGSDRSWAVREHARMQALGIPTEVLLDDDLKERFPALSPCTLAPDLETGEAHVCTGGSHHLFEPHGGYADPVAAVQDLAEACRNAGIEVRFRTRVVGVGVTGGRVQHVSLASRDTLDAPLVINAAGPWCRELYESAGLDMPWDLVPVRVQILYRDRPPELKGHIPVTADMSGGIYFRAQNSGQQIVVGSVLAEDEKEVVPDPDNFQREADDDFQHLKLHVLHHRLPALPYRGKVRGYCGLYTMNRDDVHPVVGPTPIEGFWIANGFSGHGFKLAPAIGSLVAQAITGEKSDFDTGVPLSYLAIDRLPIKADTRTVLA